MVVDCIDKSVAISVDEIVMVTAADIEYGRHPFDDICTRWPFRPSRIKSEIDTDRDRCKLFKLKIGNFRIDLHKSNKIRPINIIMSMGM